MVKESTKNKAVIFDMDGVITDTMPYHFRAWKIALKEAGIIVSERDIYLREGQPGNVTVKEIFKERGLRLGQAGISPILARKEELFKKLVSRRFIPGSLQFIHFLRKNGFRLALVTGTARNEARSLLPSSLWRLFSVIITGTDVKIGKPHPEPYLAALKKLKTGPDEAIVIENAPFGIRSAKSAGLVCIALETSLPKSYLKSADYVFPSYRELKKKFDFL